MREFGNFMATILLFAFVAVPLGHGYISILNNFFEEARCERENNIYDCMPNPVPYVPTVNDESR